MPEILLTFDNGPEADVTPRVLDVLARRGIPATFFVVGEKLRRPGARAIAARAVAEGHAIGNHTLTHGTPLGELGDDAAAREEIEAAQREIGDLAHPDRLFRPFGGGGHLDERFLDLAAADGARFVRGFPDACVPIRRGRVTGSLDGLVVP